MLGVFEPAILIQGIYRKETIREKHNASSETTKTDSNRS